MKKITSEEAVLIGLAAIGIDKTNVSEEALDPESGSILLGSTFCDLGMEEGEVEVFLEELLEVLEETDNSAYSDITHLSTLEEVIAIIDASGAEIYVDCDDAGCDDDDNYDDDDYGDDDDDDGDAGDGGNS